MNDLNDLHDQAMDLVFMGRVERRRGNFQLATEMLERALELEMGAIACLDGFIEPSYSVLRRSAGWIAIDCGNFRLAERLACEALAREPSSGIASELRELLDHAMFRIRLRADDVECLDDEVDLCMAGSSISFQNALFSDVFGRADNFRKMYHRVAQWRNAAEYSSHIPAWVRQQYPLFTAKHGLRAHGVSFRLGGLGSQPSLFADLSPSQIIGDVAGMWEAVDTRGVAGLSERGLEGDYCDSIIYLLKQIAPDGVRVRRVGLMVASGDKTRVVSLDRRASDIIPISYSDPIDPTVVHRVTGMLRLADAHDGDRSVVTVYPISGGTPVNFRVPSAWMDEVVRPMWNTHVFASGAYRRSQGGDLDLIEIFESDQVHGSVIGAHVVPDRQEVLPRVSLFPGDWLQQ